MFELTGFEKNGGPLTKIISLSADGNLVSDGSACVMSEGTACRLVVSDLAGLAAEIDRMDETGAVCSPMACPTSSK